MPEALSCYGRKWPEGWPKFLIELYCWSNFSRLKQPELDRWRHLKNAIILLDEEMRTGWNDWTEMMCWAYGTYPYIAALGCTASTKTHTFHKLAFYDYMSNPLKTTMTCTTTNSAGLEQRMWPIIQSSYSRMKRAGIINDWKSTVAPQRMVRPRDGETKNVIRAVTIDPKADKQKIVDQLIGVHPERRIWVVDEGTSAPPAILDAWANAMAATQHKRFVMLGNTNDYADPLGVFCTPVGGWSTVNEDTEKWEFEFYGERGIGLHFDGRKSPNFKYPLRANGKSKWTWLYDHDTLRAHESIRALNPITYWRMCVGWFMPEGLSKRVCSWSAIDKYKCKSDAMFRGGDIKHFLSLDPAFGGDRCMLMVWKMGYCLEAKRVVIQRVGKYQIPVDPKNLPGEQIGKFCLAEANKVGATTIGIDTTTNNSAAAEWLSANTALQVLWIPFGGAASDERNVSDEDDRTCKDAYFNKAAELAFGVANHLPIIRGLDQETCTELCSRFWEPIGEKPTRQRVETKDDYKERMKKSPDDADCVAIGVETFLQIRGSNKETNPLKSSAWNRFALRKNKLFTSTYGTA